MRMKISVVAATNTKQFATKEDFENFSGHAAGICYMKDNFSTIEQEDVEKTKRRVAQTKNSGHHSVYDHEMVSLYLEDIPKALAMVLNNEQMYTTSEKSARYTKMVPTEAEQKLYDKWLQIFKNKITEAYGNKGLKFFEGNKIEKLAQENARYLLSVFTPTSMMYTVSYRQLNYLYGFLKQEIERENQNALYTALKPAMEDLCEAIENLDYFDETLTQNGKLRTLSLVTPSSRIFVPTYGDTYTAIYKGSFAQYAQAQRHRTLNYTMQLLEKPEFYVPPILKDDADLMQEWVKDCNQQAETFPQGMLVQFVERGTLENFILKLMERKCSCAQLEINQQVNQTLKEYAQALEEQGHPMAEELKKYTKGARCTFPGYTCSTPCGFAEGINETRKI